MKHLNCRENNQTCHLLNMKYDSYGLTTLIFGWSLLIRIINENLLPRISLSSGRTNSRFTFNMIHPNTQNSRMAIRLYPVNNKRDV